MNNVRISTNFKLYEFECKDGSHLVKVDENLVEKIQKLRDYLGKPIIVVSGYRTPEYNKLIGGAPKSQHMQGKAADIKVTGVSPYEVAKAAKTIGFNGIGIYPTFTHIDVRATKSYWKEVDGKLVVIYSI
jgi:zinc D-Ala-D-Ala carboxypeptidase